MNFDATDATLEAALAFIDSFDGSSAAPSAACASFSASDPSGSRPGGGAQAEDDASSTASSSSSPLLIAAHSRGCNSAEDDANAGSSGSDGSSPSMWGIPTAKGDAQRRAKKKKSTAQASKRLREKKKKEMAALMEEAAELEARLATLQRRATIAFERTGGYAQPTGADDGSDGYLVAHAAGAARTRLLALCPAEGETSWLDVVVREERQLKLSEALNTELRRALEDQSKLADALGGFVYGHPAAMSAVSALDQFRRQYPDRGLDSPFEDLITDLQLQISGLYVDTDTVFKPEGAGSISSSMRTRRDDTGSLILEIETTTPVAFPLQDAMDFLGAGFEAKDAQDDKLIIDKRSSELELDKRFVVEIAAAGSKEKFNGALFMRRFHEQDRLVIVYGETLTPPSATMQIREKAWLLVSASTSPTGPLSHVRSFFQATVATRDQSSDAKLAAEVVLREWGRQVFLNRQLIQNVILEQASRRVPPL